VYQHFDTLQEFLICWWHGGRIHGVQGVRIPPSGRKCPFCWRVQFSNQNFRQKRHSFIVQNQTFSPEKTPIFLATMERRGILIFKFSGGGLPDPRSELRRSPWGGYAPAVCARIQSLHPRSRNPVSAPLVISEVQHGFTKLDIYSTHIVDDLPCIRCLQIRCAE
jgi:hypothetical protein